MAIKGIDISKYQTDVDYKKVKADGVEFAILRIGYTGYGTGKRQAKDTLFETHYKGCRDAGINIGGYFFGRGVSAEEGKKEAEYVLSLIKGKTFEYPIFYDTEDTYYQAKATKAQNTAACKAFCDAIKAAGYKTGIYASKSWFTDKLNDNELQAYDHWVAQYYNKITYNGSYTMWQYTSSGKVNGIKGNVDMNWCYKNYIEKTTTPAPVTPTPVVPTPVAPKPTASTKKTFGKTGDKITLSKANLYAASTSSAPSGNPKTGTYYIWDNEVVNGRIRITNTKERVGKTGQITGWVNIAQISTTTPTSTPVTPKPATPKPADKYAVGAEVKLVKGKLYIASTGKTALTKTKTYYIYDGIKINGRYRVTNNKKNCGKKPLALYVSGWVEI